MGRRAAIAFVETVAPTFAGHGGHDTGNKFLLLIVSLNEVAQIQALGAEQAEMETAPAR